MHLVPPSLPAVSTSMRLFLALVGVATTAAGAAQDERAEAFEVVYWDGPMENGQLTGGRVWLARPDLSNLRGVDGGYVTIINNGPPANRIDLVTVGDGYLSTQLVTYNDNVVSALDELFSYEPFTTYASFFNVHRVDVISPESGVDHDPTYPIWRSTALNMGFWCGGTERLLCVDVAKAYSWAINAPDVDQVLAFANSSKYGGAGYSASDLATLSGRNGSSPQVAIHELGHSLGNLADEYDDGGPETYNGSERPEPNVSILSHAQMKAAGTKWSAWLGNNDARYDGLVSTYEGAHYSRFGIYRPTGNSMMRALNRPFNLPSIESLVIEFYKIVDLIDDSTPESEVLHETSEVWIEIVEPVGAPIDIQWFLDGDPIVGATAETIDLATVSMTSGTHQLSVAVVDNTSFVRNEAARTRWMTDAREWTVEAETGRAELLGLVVQVGTLRSGGIDEANASDDAYLVVGSGRGMSAVEPFLTEVQYEFGSGVTDATAITIRLESHITEPVGVVHVSIRNHLSGDFDRVATYVVGTDDSTRVIDGLDPARYLSQSTGRVSVRVRHIVVGAFLAFSFDSAQDEVAVVVE